MGADVVCQLANYLFPTGRVVSGHKDALNEVQVCFCGSLQCYFGRLTPIQWATVVQGTSREGAILWQRRARRRCSCIMIPRP